MVLRLIRYVPLDRQILRRDRRGEPLKFTADEVLEAARDHG
jgi:hypothetical protein